MLTSVILYSAFNHIFTFIFNICLSSPRSLGLRVEPMPHLKRACHCYATAIKYNNNDAQLHVHLGMVLEELYFAQDMLHLNKVEKQVTLLLLPISV